jgi:hypothetical protein
MCGASRRTVHRSSTEGTCEDEKVEIVLQAGHSAARSAAHEGEKVEFALQAGHCAAKPHS